MTNAPQNLLDLVVAQFGTDYAKWLEQMNFRDSHHKVVGRVAVEFSAIEYFLSYHLSRLINPDQPFPASIVLTKLNLARLLQLSKSLFHFREKDLNVQNEFDEIIDRIDALRVRRNDIVHSMWDYDYINKKVKFEELTIGRDQLIKFKGESFSIDDLDKIGQEAFSALNAFLLFVQRWNKSSEGKKK